MKTRFRWPGKRFLLYFSVIFIAVMTLFPYYWLIISSFKPPPELVRAQPTLFPETFTLQNYILVFKETNFIQYIRNSSLVGGITALVSTLLAIGAAYSTTRLRFRERGFITRLILVGYMFPPILILMPLYLSLSKLSLSNSLFGLTIVYIGLLAPFGAWLLRGFFASVPRELEEAALIDGASKFEALRLIFLPLVIPGIVSVVLYTFIMSWSEYLFALIFITSEANKTVPLGLEAWMNQYTVEWGSLTAAAVIASLPALLFFFITSKLSRGFLFEGALKG